MRGWPVWYGETAQGQAGVSQQRIAVFMPPQFPRTTEIPLEKTCFRGPCWVGAYGFAVLPDGDCGVVPSPAGGEAGVCAGGAAGAGVASGAV